MTLKKRMTWQGDKAKRGAQQGAVRGLQYAAEHVLEQSNRIVPIEEHTLEASGVASVDEGRLRAAVSYDTPYAVRQHEEMNYSHDAGRSAKYLEMIVTEAESSGTVSTIIGREIKKELRS